MNKFLYEASKVKSKRVEEIYQEIKEDFAVSEIPDFFRVLSLSENMLEVLWAGYKHILLKGKLHNSVKEMIFLTIALEKGCNYCSSTHLAICDMSNEISSQTIEYIKSDIEHVNPLKVKELLKMSLQYLKNPTVITDNCFQNLIDLGLSKEEVFEALAMSALSNLAVNVALNFGLDVESNIKDYLRSHDLYTGLEVS